MPPRAARLSRLGVDGTDANAAASGTFPPPSAPAAPAPPVPTPLPPAPTTLKEITELRPNPRAATPAASEAATAQRTKPAHMFKPLADKLATRSLLMSIIGVVLFVFPVLALLGVIGGLLSMRRIRRSEGALTGERTARLAILIGAIGVVLGGIAIGVFVAVGR